MAQKVLFFWWRVLHREWDDATVCLCLCGSVSLTLCEGVCLCVSVCARRRGVVTSLHLTTKLAGAPAPEQAAAAPDTRVRSWVKVTIKTEEIPH